MYELNQIHEYEDNQNEDELLHCGFPQPFTSIAEAMTREELVILMASLTEKRTSIKDALSSIEDPDRKFRANDKMRYLNKKLLKIDELFAKLKKEKAEKGPQQPPAGTVPHGQSTLVFFWTDRDGAQVRITNLETTEWWVRQVEGLSPDEDDMIPVDLKPRTLTTAQLERLPQWLKDQAITKD